MEKNTGGPAFPHITESGKYVYEEGMTLRDYFAAKVINGILSDAQMTNEMGKGERGPAMEIASAAYGMADAMLKARDA